ncbi:unnamed protein product, partial [marine sediment metagenome]
GRLLTSIERLKKVQDAAREAAREAKEEIEKERKEDDARQRAS